MRAVIGILFALLGALLILFTYAFASLIDPSLPDAVWRSELLHRMFLQRGLAEGTYVGIGLFVGGLLLVLPELGRDRMKGRPTARSWFARVIVIDLVVVLLARFAGCI